MGLAPLDIALWLMSFLGQVVLLGILVSRKRAVRFPLFTVFIAFEIAETAISFAVYKLASQTAYFWTYWSLAIVDALLQLGVVYEMAREVLRPTGTWVRDARAMFLLWGALGAVAAAALSFAVDPKASTDLFAWSTRLDIFTSLLIAELVLVMFLSAQRLGLQLRNWVMGLGQGLIVWISVTLCVETAHSYWGVTRQYVALDHLRIAAFIGALAYWCVSFWRAEPERRPLSPEMMKYLYTLRDNLDYDLGRVRGEGKVR